MRPNKMTETRDVYRLAPKNALNNSKAGGGRLAATHQTPKAIWDRTPYTAVYIVNAPV